MPNPFGVEAGSTPGSDQASYLVMFHAVPNPHPAFTTYNGTWSPEEGLSRINASSQNFGDDPGCYSARALYDRVRRQLEQVYGPCDVIETVDPDGIWVDDADFWNSLNSGERTHAAIWSEDAGSRLDAKLQRISLMLAATAEYHESCVMLSYDFENQVVSGPSDNYGLGSL
jgi:hypothetical protein